MDRAVARSSPGDILFLATESGSGDTAFLLDAARRLRNLTAYPAAVEVFDSVLDADASCVPALEQKALCLLLMGSENADEADSLLDRALGLVGDDSSEITETLSLRGRLNKERWYRSWFDEGDSPVETDTSENCRRAVEASYFLWAAIDSYVDSFQKTNAYYEALNAITLLSLAGHLQDVQPGSQPRPEHYRQRLWDDLWEKARDAIESGTRNPGSAEDAYWGVATQLELQITGDRDTAGNEAVDRIQELIGSAIRHAGTRRFLLNSTIRQFRMLYFLGFRHELVGPALSELVNALKFSPDPSLPACRVVFQDSLVDKDGTIDSSQSQERGDSENSIRFALGEILKGEEEFLALIDPTALSGIQCAEFCRDLGLPYELCLISSGERAASLLPGLDAPLMDRLELVKRKARDISVMDAGVGETSQGQEPRARLLRWMFARARAYGRRHVGLLLHDGTGIGRYEGMSVSDDPEEGRISIAPSASQGTVPDEAAPDVTPEPETAVVVADEDVTGFFEYCSQTDTRDRWNSYSHEARQFLMSLGLCWEPFGHGAPVMLETNTIGFELLAKGPDGERYGQIMARTEAMGVDPLDVQLVLLLKGLGGIPAARRRLRMALGIRAESLLMSVNLDDIVLRSEDFVEVVSRNRIDETTLLEVNEEVTLERVSRLRQIADTYKLRLALDDSNNMHEEVRSALLDRVDLVKVDFKFCREQLAGIGTVPPEEIMRGLVDLRQEHVPLVIEGIETTQDIAFIQNHWRKEYGPLYFQGWAVCVSGGLDRFFQPVNTKDLPKGYTLPSRSA